MLKYRCCKINGSCNWKRGIVMAKGEVANADYLFCEKNGVYYTLIAVSGFWGAFTYLLRGNTFCNAQTANVVLLGLAVGAANWKKARYYLIPISAYMLGAFVSELFPNPVKHRLQIRWESMLLAVEMAVILFLGFLPESAPVQISQVAINFIASMQYNTFRQAQGTPMATTFVTNHIRQVGIGLARELRHMNREDKSHRLAWRKHVCMLLSFFGGVVAGTVICDLWSGKALWATLLPLAILEGLFLKEDRSLGKENLERKPHGH